jgi:hypothetical protein
MPLESSVLQKSATGGPGDRDLQCRICAEYEEMPGLNLTLTQASRLFDVDVPACERVLVQLVAAGTLALVDGLFVLREDHTHDSCRARSDLQHVSL